MKNSEEAVLKKENRKLLFMAGTGWAFDAMAVGLLSFVIVALSEEWNLSLSQTSYITIANSVGMAVGALVFGLLADRIGRKKAFIYTILLFSIGSGLTALVGSLAIFLVLRFLIGMGVGGALPVASTLVSESAPVHERGRLVALLESFWAVGWMLSAIIAYFVIPDYGWRIAMVLTALPVLYAFYLRAKLPDSQVFLEKKNSQSFSEKLKLVWSKAYRKQTITLWVLWFTVVFSYYGIFLWLPKVMLLKGFDMLTSFEYVLWMTLAQLPGYFVAAWLIEKIGRKFVLVAFLLGTMASAYFFGNATELSTILIAGALLSFFNMGAWGGLYAYTPEQYPTMIRGTGAGMAASFGRIGGIIGPLLVPVFAERGYEVNFIFAIFCLAILIGILTVIFLGKETKDTVIE